MFKSTLHRITHDYIGIMFLFILCYITFHFLNSELRSENLLYTYHQLESRCDTQGLGYLNWIFDVKYSSKEEFFKEFVPSYMEAFPDKVAAAICTNSSAMIVALFFPMFLLTRKFASAEPMNAIMHGKSKTKVFFSFLLETCIWFVFIFNLSALVVFFAKGVAISSVSPLLLVRVFVLRIPMILAWIMPTVFFSFLFQNMFLSGLSSIAVFVFQVFPARTLSDSMLFPYWTWTQNHDYAWFWSSSITASDVVVYLTPCILIILFWIIASFVAFSLRPIRSDAM